MVIMSFIVPAILVLLTSSVPLNVHGNGCPDGMKEVIHSNFSQWSPGKYMRRMLDADFRASSGGKRVFSGGDLNSAEIVEDEDFCNNVLRIKYKAGKAGCGGINCPLNFKSYLGNSFNKVYYSMKLKFGGHSGAFEWIRGGKLPGVCGGTCNTGGKIPNGFDGFNDRIMWRTGGNLMSYVYHAKMTGRWGEDMLWNNTRAPQKTWVKVAQLVEMNNPNYSDGKIKSWVDDKEVLSRNNVKWRSTEKIAVDKFHFSTFFGGASSSWAPSKDMHIFFDDILVCVQ